MSTIERFTKEIGASRTSAERLKDANNAEIRRAAAAAVAAELSKKDSEQAERRKHAAYLADIMGSALYRFCLFECRGQIENEFGKNVDILRQGTQSASLMTLSHSTSIRCLLGIYEGKTDQSSQSAFQSLRMLIARPSLLEWPDEEGRSDCYRHTREDLQTIHTLLVMAADIAARRLEKEGIRTVPYVTYRSLGTCPWLYPSAGVHMGWDLPPG